jgi:hypothetical protein
VELRYVDTFSDQTVRRTLEKTLFSRGGRNVHSTGGSSAKALHS